LALIPGNRLGVYQVAAQIGEGGMGQVYRARDTKLNRDVALKVLPDSLASDHDRLARLTREAQTLASLNHPNIAHIHGLEEASGVRALVMELVEGEDLSQRIARGAIALDEALPIAKQVAEALEAAHQQGIIHRDLKPANIKVRPDGTVKVLDFGLAKAMDLPGAMSPSVSQSPTITTPAMTQAGMILGTAAYMAPEQAKGKPVDKRADIWAFGAVLYEMLTGRRAFKGEDTTDTIVAVVSREPDWSALPPDTPPAIRRLLRRCLEKDRTRRLADAADARLEVEDGLTAPAADLSGAMAARSARPWLPWALVATLSVALVAGLFAWAPWRPAPALGETRVDIVTPGTTDTMSFALSPNGRQIAFVASGDGGPRLWLRSLATTTPQPLAGTEGASFPFWSPDGRSIGFFAATALKRLDLGGGAPQALAPVVRGFGGTWHADGVIVFAPGRTGPLMRVSATGGEAVAVTTLGRQQLGHLWPHALPDGRRFLFFVRGAPDTSGIYLGTLDGSAPTRLTPADSAGVHLPEGAGPADASRGGGRLLWVRAGALVARRLDVAQAALTGEPITLVDGMQGYDETYSNRSAVSVAATGLIAYRTRATSRRQLTWFDRSGTARGTVGDPDRNGLSSPSVSPDGRRVAVSRTVEGNTDVWLLDGARMSRVTVDAASERFPLWSPDGTRLVFSSSRSGPFEIYQRLAGGAGVEERLVAADQMAFAASWSPDGGFLLYVSTDPQTLTDLWVLPMAGDRVSSVFLQTPFLERWGTFSPDGRWVAYHSNQSGQHEIYVRPFIPPGASGTAPGANGGERQASTSGGVYPVWRRDSRELYYLNPEGAMMAVPIAVTGATLQPGAAIVLFPTRILGGGVDRGLGPQYDVARDGRFLINTVLDDTAAPITLLMNWNPEAKK
jgi:tRNA A-37 threonylcarbamoyl transferase component Bud32